MNKNSVHSDLYNILNVSSTATVAEIKKSYKKLAKEYHPDKNPNSGDKFKEISYAHEVLTDPHKRTVYDQYGIKGLQKGHRSSSGPSFMSAMSPEDDLMSMMFGMGGTRTNFPFRHQNHDTLHPYTVTLEDLYASKPVRIFVNRNVICFKCKGNGTKSGMRHLNLCYACGGNGVKLQYAQFLFPMHQQVQCITCKGSGYILPEGDCCINCRGKKVCVEKKGLDFWIEKGMKDNQKIVLRGKGDQAPNKEPGNIVVILQEAPHEVFKRIGDDLFVEKEITLVEALCGFSFALKHLDGRVLRIMQPPGVCVKADQVKGIRSEGMPLRIGTEKGDLYIKFKVKFPENYFANETQIKELENVLGPRPTFTMPEGENTEEVDLHEFDASQAQENSRSRHREAYSEDEDDGCPFYGNRFGVPSATCAQQ